MSPKKKRKKYLEEKSLDDYKDEDSEVKEIK